MANKLGFYFNGSACTGCKACQIACKDKSDLPVGVTWRRVAEYSGGEWVNNSDGTCTQNVFAYYISVACNHCDNPICAEVCPTQAMFKREDGIVLIDESKCIGCRYCEWTCPYGAPQFEEDQGVMTKCNLCYDSVDEGQSPSCVAACPSRALFFGDIDHTPRRARESGRSGTAAPGRYHQPESRHPTASPCKSGRFHGWQTD